MNWFRQRRIQQEAAKATRWIVIDTEASGLDPKRDRLIALAAVAVHLQDGRPRLRPTDSFEVVLHAPPQLQLDAVARQNILLHGVGRGAQRQGLPLRDGLQQLLDFADGAPCLAFHAGFDAELLQRAQRESQGSDWPLPWLCLAVMARRLHPELPHRQLDDWLAHFRLEAGTRHRASSDAWAAAELLQCLWPRWRSLGPQPWAEGQRLVREQRWLS
jgi:DNA polymerase III subunit epsilon